MSINSFTFDGVSSEDMGLYVGGQRTFGAPQRDVTKVSIPGRNGDLVRDNGRFLNSEIAYNIVAMNDFKETAQNVRNWLMSAKGYKRLEDTYHPEHYRMARVSGGIDFETGAYNATGKAQILFDCVPQRFLKSGEEISDASMVNRTESGDLLSFEAIAESPITSASVSLSPIQSLNGYDSPWPAGGGKNLLFAGAVNETRNGLTITAIGDGSSFRVSGTAIANVALTIPTGAKAPEKLKSGVTYTISGGHWSSTNVAYIQLIYKGDTSGNTISIVSSSGPFTYTASEDATLTGIFINLVNGNTFSNDLVQPQLEIGSTATAFSPYSNICPISGHTGAELNIAEEYESEDATTYSVTFTDQGTVYGGTYDFVTGALKVTHKTLTVDGTQAMTWNSGAGVVQVLGTGFAATDDITQFYSDRFMAHSISGVADMNNEFAVNSAGILMIKAPALFTSLGAASTYFVNNPTQFVGLMSDPLEYTLTSQQLNTLLGANNVWGSGEITLTYVEPGVIENPTPFEAKPLIRVYGSGTCTVTINNQIITINNVTDFVDIDCETMNCYNGVVNKNADVVLGAQGFPVLPAGKTMIKTGGGTTKIEITPRWWEV